MGYGPGKRRCREGKADVGYGLGKRRCREGKADVGYGPKRKLSRKGPQQKGYIAVVLVLAWPFHALHARFHALGWQPLIPANSVIPDLGLEAFDAP
eukprot:177369-Chlamydomonas_euryale.AAC.1